MHYIEICSIKINLNLRVLFKRGDGYHEIHSLFWRRRSPEVLEISTNDSKDELRVEGMSIAGENLATAACAFIRARRGGVLPPLTMRLVKFLPPGSGLGAGSGNAAAVLKYFQRTGGVLPSAKEIATLGADVAFLASRYDLALADGVGDEMEGLDETLDLPCVIAFPKWSSDTRAAYAALRADTTCAPNAREEAREESRGLLSQLRLCMHVGLLPNDFMLCHTEHRSCYNEAYAAFEKSGALAWGLCGSGSSCFALFPPSNKRLVEDAASRLRSFSWLHKIMFLE